MDAKTYKKEICNLLYYLNHSKSSLLELFVGRNNNEPKYLSKYVLNVQKIVHKINNKTVSIDNFKKFLNDINSFEKSVECDAKSKKPKRVLNEDLSYSKFKSVYGRIKNIIKSIISDKKY